MSSRLALLTVLVVLAGVAAVTGCTVSVREQTQEEAVPLLQPLPKQWVGAGSCAAAGCHNANGFKGALGSEYTTWVVHDSHARAYEVLFNVDSRRIVKNLFPAASQPAHETALCLNCHVHRDFETANHHRRFAREDGVSCESCHGPAGGWISEHYKPGWSRKDMWDTRSLTGRVQTCVACHVGTPGLEVNHDLIAAGHPRLAFDFSAYHALMPHHWQDAKDRQRDDWDAAAWFVGETMTTKAALELLVARAQSKIWPEFAEYDCYACHHQLKNQSWRQERDFTHRKPGTLPWNDWYVNTLPYRLAPGKGSGDGLLDDFAHLTQIMEKQATPDRKLVQEHAAKAIKGLDAMTQHFRGARLPSQDLAMILQQIADQGANKKAGSWDEAVKNYLAFVAVHQAWRDGKNPHAKPPEVTDALKTIRGLLQFPSGVNSPQGFTPDLLLEPFGLLRKRLGSS